MTPSIPILAFSVYLVVTFTSPASASQPSEETGIPGLVQKMEAAYKEVQDYTCEVEQVFYQEGVEHQRYRFKYYLKKQGKIRVDFYYPYPTLSFFYTGGGKEVTAVPLRSLGLIKFHLSVDNPKIRTLAGQKIDQTDMGYFIHFLIQNLNRVPQKQDEFEEDKASVRFWLQALDYVQGKDIERYRITLSKGNWLPTRIERYTMEMKPLELTLIKNYTINTHLEDRVFIP